MWQAMSYYIIISLIFSSVYSTNECVFEDYLNCIQVADCCRVQIDTELMCVSKDHLWNNFQERFEERYKDSDENLKSVNLDFNYKEGQNMCVKWREINSPFFTEFNIDFNCECNFGMILKIVWGLILTSIIVF